MSKLKKQRDSIYVQNCAIVEKLKRIGIANANKRKINRFCLKARKRGLCKQSYSERREEYPKFLDISVGL